ncbi:LpqB family beta-propeller domain-containing protein, partial [Georgenia sp. 10Sc9-8]|nr:LpqB family beta-propeller domain-containing protein [Georgenia halotolerans]
MAPRRAVRALLLLLATLLALAGCVSLPRSGPVTASDPDLPVPELGLAAAGPAADADPTAIVQGFLRASAAGLSDDFTVAREFLAGPAQNTWDPSAQVRVYANDPAVEFTTNDDGGVRVRAPAQSSIDDEGRYTESAPGSVIEADFTLARTGGEWRIIDLEDGILLSEPFLVSLYAQRPLYFLSQDGEALVPDVRWYPRRNLATSLVRGLLEGPSSWLTPAVFTAVPAGTSLTVASVVVQDGVAQVDLSTEAQATDPATRALMVAQIEATLRDVPSVRDTRVTVGGSTFDVPAEPDLDRDPYVSMNPLVVSGGVLAQFTGSPELEPLAGADQLGVRAPRHPAMGYEENPVMVLLDGSDRLAAAATESTGPVTLLEGPDLVPPSVDRLGWVWTGPAAAGGPLRAVRQNGTEVQVGVPWLAGREVRALRISRDGARAVVVSATGDAGQVDVAAVIRDSDGTP